MNSQDQASQRRLEHEAAALVDGADLLDQQRLRQTLRERRLPLKYVEEVEALLPRLHRKPTREMALMMVIGGEILDRRARAAEKGRQRQIRRASR